MCDSITEEFLTRLKKQKGQTIVTVLSLGDKYFLFGHMKEDSWCVVLCQSWHPVVRGGSR